MAETKRFIVIGLGTFGTALAARLSANNCRVTGLDLRKDRVEDVRDVLHEAVIGDATDREVLEQLSVDNANAVFISLGDNIARSLLATLHCQELHARRIIAKGVTAEHGKILKALGVDRVVFPEIELATELADRVTWPNVLDFLPIDQEYSVVEIAVPESLAGQTLSEVNLRRRYGVWVMGLKDALTGKLEILPNGDVRLTDSQLLLVVGKQAELNHLRELA